MIVAPIGTWLVTMDTAVTTGIAPVMQGMVQWARIPLTFAIPVLFGFQGIQVAKGDPGPLRDAMTTVIKVLLISALALQSATYLTWIFGFFYNSIPNALSGAAFGAGATNAANANGIQVTGAAFDQLWGSMEVPVAHVRAEAGVVDVGSKVAALACEWTVGAGLLVMAFVYLLARILMAVVLVFGSLALISLLFRSTQGFFERWIGKVIALIFMQVAGLIILQIVMTADKTFMQQITAQIAASPPLITWNSVGHFFTDSIPRIGTTPEPPALAGEVQNLAAIGVWFVLGALSLLALPSVAYSLGTGVAVSTQPLLNTFASSVRGAFGALPALAGPAGAAGALTAGAEGAAPNYGLSMASRELAAPSSIPALPPPPPPSLSASTPYLIGQ